MSTLYYTGTIVVLLAIGLCLWHASTREEYAFLAVGFVYGYILEQVMITMYETYHYVDDGYALMLFDVPINIAIAWTAILYSGWQIGRSLGLSPRRVPFFVALFGLHIDLAMDIVAIRVPYWTWEIPGLWFGVPLNNFYGWYLVAFFFVGSYVVLEGYVSRPELRLVAVLPASLGLLVGAVFLWSVVLSWSTASEVATVLGLIVVGLVAVATDAHDPQPLPYRLIATPLIFHLFFLGVLLVLGFHVEQPLVLVVSVAMLAVGLALHLYPLWYRRRRNRSTAG